MNRDEVSKLVQRVLKESSFSMRQMANLTGNSYAALRTWSIGHRVPTEEGLLRLALAFEVHADRLREMARELREAASKQGGES